MRLIYVSNLHVPARKSYGLQIVKNCEAFAGEGLHVELISPKGIFRKVVVDVFDHYNAKRIFTVKYLSFVQNGKTLRKIFRGFSSFVSEAFFLPRALYAIFPYYSDIIYTRDKYFALVASFLGWNIFYEAHDAPSKKFLKLLKRAKGIVVITEGLRSAFLDAGIKKESIFVAADGVDLKNFTIPEGKYECRGKLGLPADKTILVYTGQLYPWKGGDTLAEASRYLGNNVFIYLVGGSPKYVEEYRKKYENHNVKIMGYRPHSEMPYWMGSADVLILPNSGRYDTSSRWTSPTKLFEYMASKRPIVASAVPSTREILDENTAVFFKPDNSKSLADAVRTVLGNKDLANKVSANAFTKVADYTWQKRAEKILNFIVHDRSNS